MEKSIKFEAMSPRRKKILKFSNLGLLGLLGFFFDNPWIRNALFIVGGLLAGIGYILEMQIQAERTLARRKNKDPSENDLG